MIRDSAECMVLWWRVCSQPVCRDFKVWSFAQNMIKKREKSSLQTKRVVAIVDWNICILRSPLFHFPFDIWVPVFVSCCVCLFYELHPWCFCESPERLAKSCGVGLRWFLFWWPTKPIVIETNYLHGKERSLSKKNKNSSEISGNDLAACQIENVQ